MTQAAPGKHYREGLSLVDAVKMFSDETATERWFVEARWPNGIACPFCGSLDEVAERPNRKPQPYRCRACRKDFSVKTGSIMHGSKLPLSTWAYATYLLTTNLKGVSSMKLHRDLGVTQKTAWHLAHRIRRAWEADQAADFTGPVEVDETYVGGLAKNKHASERDRIGKRGGLSVKAAVIGVKDRDSGQVRAQAIASTDGDTLRGFVRENAQPGAQVYSDGHGAYMALAGEYKHAAVQHSVGTYVIEQAHTNGIESFWSMLKRGYQGTYHRMSPKHLDRYVGEFAGRHNARPLDTINQMHAIVRGMSGKRLRYADLVS